MLLVALRKESVDRNILLIRSITLLIMSLSARRAWIEILVDVSLDYKEVLSLSARRAWIEMSNHQTVDYSIARRSPQGERG